MSDQIQRPRNVRLMIILEMMRAIPVAPIVKRASTASGDTSCFIPFGFNTPELAPAFFVVTLN